MKFGSVGVVWNIAQNHSLGSRIKSLFAPFHMKSLPKMRFGQIGVRSDIAEDYLSSLSQDGQQINKLISLPSKVTLCCNPSENFGTKSPVNYRL